MPDILYIALSQNELLANAFRSAGQNLIHLSHESGLDRLQHGGRPFQVIVLQWRSRRDQAIIARAKVLGLPVLATTGHLTAALRAPGERADVYLEDPVEATEVVDLAVDLQRALPERRVPSGVRHGFPPARAAVHT
jgi:hypothetical protein